MFSSDSNDIELSKPTTATTATTATTVTTTTTGTGIEGDEPPKGFLNSLKYRIKAVLMQNVSTVMLSWSLAVGFMCGVFPVPGYYYLNINLQIIYFILFLFLFLFLLKGQLNQQAHPLLPHHACI